MKVSAGGEPQTQDAGAGTNAPPAAHIVGRSEARLWGMTPQERLRRSFVRAGVTAVTEDPAPVPSADQVVLVRADHVLDEALVKALLAAPRTLLLAGDGRTVVAAHVAGRDAPAVAATLRGEAPMPPKLRESCRSLGAVELGSAYNDALRKRAPPLLLRLTPDTVDAVERATFDGSYKGVTDLVTKYVWPAPARWVTKRAALHGISPDAVTWCSLLLVILAYFLFARGDFLAGLVAAWGMTFLDTVDGKLARVTLTSTKFGNAFDHGIDLIHPPFWYYAWAVGLATVGMGLAQEALVLAIVIGGYVLGRVQEGLFIWLHGIEIHIWRPIDSRFRLITARRNPNLLLLTVFALFERPDTGLLAVAIWTVISLVFHFWRLAAAGLARRRGPLVSWLAGPQAP